MSGNVEGFDLAGQRALVVGNVAEPIDAIADACAAAGAMVTRQLVSPSQSNRVLPGAIAVHDSLDILISGFDSFLARPVCEIAPEQLSSVMLANFASQFTACQMAIEIGRAHV